MIYTGKMETYTPSQKKPTENQKQKQKQKQNK